MNGRAPIALALLLGCAASAQATSRVAVVVGNNIGGSQDGALQFAEDDALRMADALLGVGGFAPSDVTTLRGADASATRQAILGVNTALRDGAHDESMLLVYYSGHSDARALHLGTSELPLSELEAMVRSSPARFRILIVDSCRSGVLTRAKGGRAAPSIALSALDDSAGEGMVILTAAAIGEDAQESDALQGSFFTHHLVSGLLGAADVDGDATVTLAEMYTYAHENTIRDSSQGALGIQHPAYRYDIRGSGDIALARLRDAASQSLVRLPVDVDVLVFRGDRSGRLVAESRSSHSAMTLALRPGTYFVRARGNRVLWEGGLEVPRTGTQTLELNALDRVEYARLARKGGGVASPSAGPTVAAVARTPLTGTTPCAGLVVGADVAIGSAVVAPRVAACREDFTHATLHAQTLEVALSVGVQYAVDLPLGLAASVGPEAGLAYLHQSFDTTDRRAPDNNLVGPFLGVTAGVALALPFGFAPAAFVFGRTYALPVERQSGAAEVAALFAAGAGVGVTKYF